MRPCPSSRSPPIAPTPPRRTRGPIAPPKEPGRRPSPGSSTWIVSTGSRPWSATASCPTTPSSTTPCACPPASPGATRTATSSTPSPATSTGPPSTPCTSSPPAPPSTPAAWRWRSRVLTPPTWATRPSGGSAARPAATSTCASRRRPDPPRPRSAPGAVTPTLPRSDGPGGSCA